VSVLPFIVVSVVAGVLSLALRSQVRISAAVAVVGLAASLVAAATIRSEAPSAVAGAGLAGSEFLRLFLVLGCLTGLLALPVAAAGRWPKPLPGAMLLASAGLALALASSNAFIAIAAATVAAVAGTLVIRRNDDPTRGLLAALRELRALAVGGALAIVAIAIAAIGQGGVDGPSLGLACLAVAGATGIRLGGIPFHLRAARVAESMPAVALPLVMLWAPAAFTVVAIGWLEAVVVPRGASLPAEQALVLVAAGASVLFGTAAALLHEDLEHIVAYSIVADAGVALLALAALEPGAGGAARGWLLGFVVGKSALAAWVAAMHATFDRHRLGELSGWARRAPLLGGAIVAIAIGAFGWPGAAVFEARRQLADLAVGGPLATLLIVGSMSAVAIYGRLLAVGLAAPGPSVRAGPAWPPRRPAARLTLEAGWATYRTPAAAAAVLAISLVAVIVSGGGLGAREAAAAPAIRIDVPAASAAPGG
jgi:NADH:ubiquinone oxidoreductase subunit 2 (subunit N)